GSTCLPCHWQPTLITTYHVPLLQQRKNRVAPGAALCEPITSSAARRRCFLVRPDGPGGRVPGCGQLHAHLRPFCAPAASLPARPETARCAGRGTGTGSHVACLASCWRLRSGIG